MRFRTDNVRIPSTLGLRALLDRAHAHVVRLRARERFMKTQERSSRRRRHMIEQAERVERAVERQLAGLRRRRGHRAARKP